MHKLVNFRRFNLWKKKLLESQNYVEKVDFPPSLDEIYSCQVNVKNDGHNWHIKISAKDEWTATDIFQLLEKLVV